jgi:hypothetical protein
MNEAEQADMVEVRKQNAELLREKAEHEANLRDQIIKKLDSLTSDVHLIRMSTSQLPQIMANQDTLGQRIRAIEDFKIKATFTMIIAMMLWGAAVFGFWKWADHFFWK